MSAKYIPQSLTRFSVIVEGSIVRYFDTADEAMKLATSCVYLDCERWSDMEELLCAGRIAEWSYGFTGVMIVPPRGNSLCHMTPNAAGELVPACKHGYPAKGCCGKPALREDGA